MSRNNNKHSNAKTTGTKTTGAKNGGNTLFCPICFKTKGDAEARTHNVKNAKGEVTCPILMASECKYCHQLGHILAHCPLLKEKEASRVDKSDKQESEAAIPDFAVPMAQAVPAVVHTGKPVPLFVPAPSPPRVRTVRSTVSYAAATIAPAPVLDDEPLHPALVSGKRAPWASVEAYERHLYMAKHWLAVE